MAEYFAEFMYWLAALMRRNLDPVATALVATLLVIYGNDINSAVKARIKNQYFPVRVLIFVLVCAFGYGAATVAISMLLAGLLREVGSLYLAPVVIVFLLVVGLLADRKKQI